MCLAGRVHIVEVELSVSNPAEAADYFAQTLGAYLGLDEGRPAVTIGASRLILMPGRAGEGVHHLAFDIPIARFTEHRDWLQQRVPLLTNAAGESEFEGPSGWNSRSVYFSGPDQMVLELIGRRSRPQPPTGHQPMPQLMSISEVGVAVADVPAAVRELRSRLGVEVLGAASAEFAPVGDHFGLLILVTYGRGWLPVFDVHAEPLPLHLTLQNSRASQVEWTPTTLHLNDVAAVATEAGTQ